MSRRKEIERDIQRYITMDFAKEFQELNIPIPEISRIETLPLPKCDKCNKQAVHRSLTHVFCWYHAFLKHTNS